MVLNKVVEVETCLLCKTLDTYIMWLLRVFFSGKFMSVPGERFRICRDPVLEIALIYILLLISSMIIIIIRHLKFIDIKFTHKFLIDNCNTALKKKLKPGSLPILTSEKKNNNRCYLLSYPIFHSEFISEYT